MEQDSQSNTTDHSNRTDKLISELKIYKTVNHGLHFKINSLESNAHTTTSAIACLQKKLDNSNAKIEFLEKEKMCLIKKYKNKIDVLQKEIKRNDIFNKKIIGTLKTKNESYMIQEMDLLRSVNRTLLGFVEILSKKFGFDSDIAKSLCDVANGVDDNILQLFLQDIESKNKD